MARSPESVSQQLAHILVKRQAYLQRYASHASREVRKLLAIVDRRIIAALRGLDEGFSRTRLEAVLAAIRQLEKASREKVAIFLTRELSQLAAIEADFAVAALTAAYPIKVSWTAPTVSALRTLVSSRPFQGRVLAEWAAEISLARVRRLTQAVRIAFVEGQTIPELTGLVEDVLQIDARGAEAITRTAVNAVANAVRDDLYRENDDLIKAVQWVSTLDGRTTPICISRDGKQFPVDSGPRPPAHYNCRSTTIPITKSWAELGLTGDDPNKPIARPFIADTRKLKDIPQSEREQLVGIVKDQTYPEWLADQSRAFQEDVLGIERAAIFRRGELPIEKFVANDGDWLTLEELRKLEARTIKRH